MDQNVRHPSALPSVMRALKMVNFSGKERVALLAVQRTLLF